MSVRILHRLAWALVLLLPWALLHARAAAEIAIDLVAVCFVVRCAVERQWGWLRQGWVALAAAWWGWLIVCTVWNVAAPGQGPGAVAQAVAMARFLLFLAALETWVLAGPGPRRQLVVSLSLATVYVAAQTLLQFATGHNLYGAPRWGDGSLTGPFTRPRAGPTFVRMLFPALLPPVCAGLARPGRTRVGAMGLILGAVGTVVLIGQRMPVALTAFGLLVAGLLLRRLRGPVAVAILAGGTLVAATVVVSPPTFYRLVTKFSHQMEGFTDSAYGRIAERAVAIAEQHPVTGLGYDGFNVGCPLPRYFQGWHWPNAAANGDGGGGDICVTHPHNYYLQAVTDAGLPGLLLFCGLMGVWFRRLGRGLLRDPDPLRVGLFVAVLIQAWPIASTSPLQSMPIGGWFFLMLGAGLAEARDASARRQRLAHGQQHPVDV